MQINPQLPQTRFTGTQTRPPGHSLCFSGYRNPWTYWLSDIGGNKFEIRSMVEHRDSVLQKNRDLLESTVQSAKGKQWTIRTIFDYLSKRDGKEVKTIADIARAFKLKRDQVEQLKAVLMKLECRPYSLPESIKKGQGALIMPSFV